MEYTFLYKNEKNLLHVLISGPIETKKAIRLLFDAVEHPCWGPDIKLLLDYRQSSLREQSPLEAKELAKVTKRMASEIGPIKIAVLMLDHHDYGMARLWQAYAEISVPFRIKIFLNYSDSLTWLNVAV